MNIEQSILQKLKALSPSRQREVLEYIESLQQPGTEEASSPGAGRPPLDFPVDRLGAWPAGLSLKREANYGDRGR